MALTYGSLFTGAGGFDLGFNKVGMVGKWQVEIDDKCNLVLEERFPNVRRYRDVREVGGGELEAVDVICGGFPCTNVSIAGKREGLAGEQSGLWFEFERILGELRPQWAVVENVAGLLSSQNGRDFARVLRGLVELGYGVSWRILDSQNFGVAQRRRRVYIVGSLGRGSSAQVLFEREGGGGDIEEVGEEGRKVANAITAHVRKGGDPTSETYIPEVGRPLAFGRTSDHYDESQQTYVAIDVRNLREQPDGISGTLQAKKSGGYSLNYQNPVAFQQNVRDEVRLMQGDGSVAGALVSKPGMKQQSYIAFNTRQSPISGDKAQPLGAKDVGHGIAFTSEQTPKVSEGVSTTLNTYNGRKPNVASGGDVRRLTPRECERLQAFPDDFTLVEGTSDSARYRQLGNAVTVSVIEWIGRRMVAVSNGEEINDVG